MNQPVKRGRGRPPGTGLHQLRANQYTGRRAENIDYVRKAVRTFLDNFAPDYAYNTNIHDAGELTGRAKLAAVAYYNQYLTACRILLAIEGVQLYAITGEGKLKKAHAMRDRIATLGEGIKKGTVTNHSLLAELDSISRASEDEDVAEV